MAIDKSQIREIKDFQLGSEVATNMKFNFDMLADEINKNETSSSPDALVKTEQTLTEEEQSQVQTNIGVKNTVDVVGVGTPVKVTEVWQDNKFRVINSGSINNLPGAAVYRAVKVNVGDVIVGTIKGTPSVSTISICDDSNNFKKTFRAGTNAVESVYIISDFTGYLEFCSYKTNFNITIIPCKLASVLTPLGGPNRKLYEAAGAKFNEETGFYELNGLTDITEDEMAAIYSAGRIAGKDGFYLAYSSTLTHPFFKIRTNLAPIIGESKYTSNFILDGFCNGNDTIEAVCLAGTNNSIKVINTINYSFQSCGALKRIVNSLGEILILDVENIKSIISTFLSSTKLEEIRIKNLKASINFKDSPLLSKESLQYMVEKSAATSPITITLHADVYAKVASAEAEWGDIFTLSQTKNISFVQG